MYIEDPETGGETFPQVIEVTNPPHEFRSRSVAEPGQPAFTTTYLLQPENDGTRLTLHFAGYETLSEEARDGMMEDNGTGFTFMLQNIKAHIEGTPLPHPQGF